MGIVVLLVGLVVPSWILVAFGAVTAVLFALLWVRDRGAAAGLDKAGDVEPERREAAVAAAAEEDEYVVLSHDASYPREKFLEASTLGLGAVIGVLINVPVIGFALLPAFLDQGHDDHDIGPLDLYPEGKWRIVTFPTDPEVGDVSRHTVFVRYNGQVEGLPSFTVLSSHCVHLGCPVQPNGLPEDEPVKYHDVTLLGTDASGFGCPCHGGQYDNEGNRTAGPPVRALDRMLFSVRNGNLFVGEFYSVSTVEGTGADASINKWNFAFPGVHVDGPQSWLYPIQPPS